MIPKGTIFVLPPTQALPLRFLLQATGQLTTPAGKTYCGVYEYVVIPPSNDGAPTLIHAVFIKNKGITGYPNNDTSY
jgi:hypothetical protein